MVSIVGVTDDGVAIAGAAAGAGAVDPPGVEPAGVPGGGPEGGTIVTSEMSTLTGLSKVPLAMSPDETLVAWLVDMQQV